MSEKKKAAAAAEAKRQKVATIASDDAGKGSTR